MGAFVKFLTMVVHLSLSSVKNLWLSRGPSNQAVTEIFFAKAKKSTFNPNEIVQIELVDFDQLIQKILNGECFDAALVVAALIILTKKILQ